VLLENNDIQSDLCAVSTIGKGLALDPTWDNTTRDVRWHLKKGHSRR